MARLLAKENGNVLRELLEWLLSHTDTEGVLPRTAGGVVSTVQGSPQIGPRGPHMVQVLGRLQTEMLSGLLGRCLDAHCVSAVVGNDSQGRSFDFTSSVPY